MFPNLKNFYDMKNVIYSYDWYKLNSYKYELKANSLKENTYKDTI